jgi:hypothetical protein
MPSDPAAAWSSFRTAVREIHPPTDMLLDSCRLAGLSPERMQLSLPAGSFFQIEQLESSEKRAVLEKATERAFGRKLAVAFAARAGGGASASASGPRAASKPGAHSDPGVQKLMSKFDGRVIRVGKKK